MPDATPVYLEEFLKLHPADLADRLQRLDTEEALRILTQLPRGLAAAALTEMERQQFVRLAEAIPVPELSGLMAELEPKAAADLLGDLGPGRRREVLAALPGQRASSVKALLQYAEDTAGGMMSDRFIALREDMTLEEARELLRSQAREEQTQEVAYLYVTDADKRLVGVISLRDLVFVRPDRRVGDIMNREVRFVRVTDDQETVARQFEHYHYLGLPVVDAEGRLAGVVKASDAMAVAAREATEDMQLMVGLSGEERTFTPWPTAVRRRLPWLYINLATAFLAASVVDLFEGTIAKWTALVVFLPVIAGQGGNAGIQTLTVIVRDLALGELSRGDGLRALGKELLLGLINGAAVGVLVGLIGWLWKGSALLGLIACLALILNQLSAALAGVAIPLGLKALRIDPALASSIFLTTVTDVAGFFFFLGLGALAIRWFGV